MMGALPRLVISDPSQGRHFLLSPALSSESCLTPSPLSSCDSSSSSSFSLSQSVPLRVDPPRSILDREEKPQRQQKQSAVPAKTLRQKNSAKLKQITERSSREPHRECKTASTGCTKGASMHKGCCKSAGSFAADCAAVSCCPCAVFSFLSLFLIELPSSLARRIVMRLHRQICANDGMSRRMSGRDGENSHSIFTPTHSYREAPKKEQAAGIIRFSTQSLIEHFEAEHVGFGCLSRERDRP